MHAHRTRTKLAGTCPPPSLPSYGPMWRALALQQGRLIQEPPMRKHSMHTMPYMHTGRRGPPSAPSPQVTVVCVNNQPFFDIANGLAALYLFPASGTPAEVQIDMTGGWEHSI